MSDEEGHLVHENDWSERNYDPDDTIKILLATDCHLGYERTTKRDQQDDSLITFEEILQLAVENEVDFILLGGDLFHETKPPQEIISKCISLLKKYCMGTRDIKIQMLTDPELIFKDCGNTTVNFEDPNLNISIPVFSIHGNHDDPSSGATGSLDLLSVTGLVNYFGKWTNLEKIEIPPLILKKGNTYISLYGLSYINDKRLARLMRDGNFKMLRATEIPESFNMFVLHQNRACHGNSSNLNFIRQEKLPKFLNFIMWGHEHQCLITPSQVEDNPTCYISQPGSSVATSLSEGETAEKHVGLLSVNKMDFKLKALKLKTVRPFVLGDVSVSKDMPELNSKSKELWPDLICKHVRDYIEFEMMPRAEKLLTNHPMQPILPLLRVKVHTSSDDERFENNKITQIFFGDVANPMDIILFAREARRTSSGVNAINAPEKFFDFDDIYDEKQWNKTVQDGICKYFAEENNSEKLTVFTVNELNDSLASFTDNSRHQAFETLVKDQQLLLVEYLTKQNIDFNDENSIKEKLKNFQTNRMLHSGEDDEFLQMRREATRRRIEREAMEKNNKNVSNDDNVESVDDEVANTSGRGKGRGRGRARGVRGRSRAKIVISDDEDDEEEEEPQPTISRARGRGRGRGRAESTAAKRGRGKAATADNLRSFLNITTSKVPSKASMDVDRNRTRDDDFIESD